MINGQSRMSSSYHIGHTLAERPASDADITEFFLPRDMPHFCLGCTQCFLKSETLCPHAAVLDAADVLILTSPVHVYTQAGQ